MKFTVTLQHCGTLISDEDGGGYLLDSIELVESESELLVVLDALGLISPAAYAMPIEDVAAQVNHVNGGEVIVSVFMDNGASWVPGLDPF